MRGALRLRLTAPYQARVLNLVGTDVEWVCSRLKEHLDAALGRRFTILHAIGCRVGIHKSLKPLPVFLLI